MGGRLLNKTKATNLKGSKVEKSLVGHIGIWHWLL